MTISLRLSKEESDLIKSYAQMQQLSVSDLIRRTVLERIEDEYDLTLIQKAMEEYKQNPVTYSLDEVKRELEL